MSDFMQEGYMYKYT